jgi:hypothetical protein
MTNHGRQLVVQNDENRSLALDTSGKITRKKPILKTLLPEQKILLTLSNRSQQQL